MLAAFVLYEDSIGRTRLTHRVRLQDDSSVGWDPIYDVVAAPPLNAILCGTLPAGLIAESFESETRRAATAPRWNPLWFALQEASAFICWWSFGYWADRRGGLLPKILLSYLGLRVLAAAVLLIQPSADFVWRLEALFWVGLLAWGLWRALLASATWVERKVRGLAM